MKILKNISIFLGIAFCCSALIFFLNCFGSDNKISESKLIVGMECSYAPFNWIQPSSKGDAQKISGGWYACGYDVYIAKKISEIIGRKLEIVKIDWDGLLPALTSGKIDAIIAGMSATESRREAIDFTDDYYTSDIVVVLKKDSKFSSAKNINDFSGAKITGQLGTIPYYLIDQMQGVKKQTAMEDFSSIISSLSAEKIDCYVSEKPAALTAVCMNPNLTYIKFEENNGFKYDKDQIEVRAGIRKGDEKLKNEINYALSLIDKNLRNELMEKAVEQSFDH